MKISSYFKKYGILVIVLLALFFLIVRNLVAYNNYMIGSQQKEFLRLARSVTYGVKQLLDSEKTALDEYFPELPPGQKETFLKMAMESYLDNMPDRRIQILYTDEDGEILFDIRNPGQTDFYDGTVWPNPEELGTETVFGRAVRIANHAYAVPIIMQVSDAPKRYIIMMMSMGEIYRYLDTAIREEHDNGYVALKNPEGYILYHKNPEQIGLHMVRGRREKYPELDFDYMEELERLQLSGQEATYVYDSYWLIEDNPVRKRKKIASFTPLQLDHEFWVLTLNLDYYAYIAPLQRYMYLGLGFSFLVFLVVGWMLIQLIRGQEEQRKMTLENRYLQELNAAMEEVGRERMQRIHMWKLGQIGVMTEKIAHDFKNFLTPVIGHAEFLADAKNLTQEQHQDVEKILEYAEKASIMTRQLNQFGRLEQIEVPFEPFDLGAQLGGWLKSIEKMCPEGITMDWSRIPESAIVYGNSTQLQEVLLNLCKNALDAIQEKQNPEGGSLRVDCQIKRRSEIPQSRFLSDEERDYLEIVVSDSGCGMTEAVIGQIFNPFFTTKKAGEGTGLGLGICYDIVIRHGGEIQVASGEGQGSSFTVYLPCKKNGQTEKR